MVAMIASSGTALSVGHPTGREPLRRTDFDRFSEVR